MQTYVIDEQVATVDTHFSLFISCYIPDEWSLFGV